MVNKKSKATVRFKELLAALTRLDLEFLHFDMGVGEQIRGPVVSRELRVQG
jgi:hypothetical protein